MQAPCQAALRASPQVAILCNHQKAVGKGHDGAMEKLQEKLKDAKHQLKELHATGGCVYQMRAFPIQQPSNSSTRCSCMVTCMTQAVSGSAERWPSPSLGLRS